MVLRMEKLTATSAQSAGSRDECQESMTGSPDRKARKFAHRWDITRVPK